jgi:outer membrane lipoprotein SlyB
LSSTVSTINSNSTTNTSTTVEAKKDGVIRIGLAGVKTGSVGDGMNASELAAAIQNSLPAYLKGTKVEIIGLEAKLASAIDAEAKEKQCDYVLYATVSHKKGGGGFGGFGKVLGNVVGQTGIGQTGTRVGNVAGQVATQSITTATANIKEKDEVTLEIKLQNGSTIVLTKQFKQKAKSAGEDIISPLVEQAANAIVTAVGK